MCLFLKVTINSRALSKISLPKLKQIDHCMIKIDNNVDILYCVKYLSQSQTFAESNTLVI